MEPVSGGAARLEAAVREAWERFRPLVRERLEALERAARHPGDAEARAAAAAAAHALAGAVGTYGFHRASRIAKEVERSLEEEAATEEALSRQVERLRRALDGPPQVGMGRRG